MTQKTTNQIISENITHEVFRVVELQVTETGYKTRQVLNFENEFHSYRKAEEMADNNNIVHVWDKKGNLHKELRYGVPTSPFDLPPMCK